uniref:Mediator of RNA polymerase II transcription subunit 16 n=1 Tax=Fundulus heteroclitus TaxID=8078 RepID=A0A3Q2Q565_FUNHE
MIHIIDTEHPWDVFSINSGHSEVISCLEWDQSGSRLLSADGDGHIRCWSMSDHLVNSWESVLSSAVDGDPIVALSWLHNGVKLALHVEMSGSTNFGEKFSRVKFSPSLTLFGGKPMEGWMAVTVSGLVTVSLLKPGGALLTASESLCRLRGRVALADIAFTSGGNIVVAATDGSSSSPVQFYKVSVNVVSEKCRIDTELLPSLFLRCTTDPMRRDKYPAVTHLKFLTRENSEQVLLCASNQSGSIMESWTLRKEGLPVNNIFQHRSPVVGEKQPTILKWRILTTTGDLERVSAVALPKLPMSISNTDLKVASDTKFCPGLGLALAFHDGSIQILHRLSLHTMGVFYGGASSAQRPGDEAAIKRQRTPGPGLHLKALQFSWTSLALAGVDNHGKLHMLRVSPSMGQVLDMNTTLRHLLFLLEYCMVTGYDWWDVLLHVQPSMVHNLVEKLHEEYMRQNQALQQVRTLQNLLGAARPASSSSALTCPPFQVLATRIVAVKASLCKLSTATAARACDYHAKLLLIAISSTLKSLLRPHVLNTPDKSPGDRLTEICAKNTDPDIDKVMINLKTEEFVLDGPPLQSLQQLIQWVGDFVLYLLANLPNQVSQGAVVRPGFGFMRDGASLALLREMLVMIRIWGLLKPGCLPTFTAMSDNQDSMQLLFRLLTKLWLCCKARCSAACCPAPLSCSLTCTPPCYLSCSPGRRPPPGTGREPDRRVLPAAQPAAGAPHGLAARQRRRHHQAAGQAAAAPAVWESLVSAGRRPPPGRVHQESGGSEDGQPALHPHGRQPHRGEQGVHQVWLRDHAALAQQDQRHEAVGAALDQELSVRRPVAPDPSGLLSPRFWF